MSCLEAEKKAGVRPQFEEFLKERVTNGFLNLKRGDWGIFVEVSKQDKAGWHNLRFDGRDILVLKNFLIKAVARAKEVDDDPFKLKEFEAELKEAKKEA